MIKIGIIGSDNSHALGIAKLCNIPDGTGNYPYEARVVAICGRGDDPAHTKEVADAGEIRTIVERPADLFGMVDAVMTVTRKGSLHVEDILPFIEAGIPCFIDKPICTTKEDAERLRAAVAKHGTPVCGGSNVRYNYDVSSLRAQMAAGGFGQVLGGSMNFAADMDSPYDGLYFYSCHLIEIMLELFGYDPVCVSANALRHDRLSVIVNYPQTQVTLNFVQQWSHYFITVYGTDRSKTVEMDISAATALGLEKFLDMIKTGKPPRTLDQFLKSVEITDAILRSVKTGSAVSL